MANSEEFETLEKKFASAGIDSTMPGFCDSPAFLAAEATEPALLLKYGRFVRTRPFDDVYARRVRQRVSAVANFFTAELARDGRLGACIDVSAVALRFLEREGIWGLVAVGSLAVEFVAPPGGRRFLHHFMHPSNPARAGHAWLCVPPFEIVDLTVNAQGGFKPDERKLLAPVFAEEVVDGASIRLEELAEPELRALFRVNRGRDPVLEDFADNELREYWRYSPARVVTTSTARLKYIECGVIAGEGVPLEQMTNLELNGRHPGALHADFLAGEAI
jgi:hypothetical protein